MDYMPILGTVFAVRMDVLNEAQAQRNHGQSLERLADRGGLGMTEAVAIVERRRWHAQANTEAAAAIAAIPARVGDERRHVICVCPDCVKPQVSIDAAAVREIVGSIEQHIAQGVQSERLKADQTPGYGTGIYTYLSHQMKALRRLTTIPQATGRETVSEDPGSWARGSDEKNTNPVSRGEG